MKEGATQGGARCNAQCATLEPSLLLFHKVNIIMWPPRVIYSVGKLNKHRRGCSCQLWVWTFKLCTLLRGTSQWKQTTGSDLYCLREAAKVKEKVRQSSSGSWEMGGALFSNFYFHIRSENKGKNKRKVPLELLGELAHLFSVLSVGIKDLSANNLFQYSLCHFLLLPPVIHTGFLW